MIRFALSVLVLSVVLLNAIASAASAQVFVPGYWRQDGTYVQPHWRTPADGNPYNNFSAPRSDGASIYGLLGRGVTPPNPNAFADGVRQGQEIRLRQQEIQLRQMQLEMLQRQLRGGR